MGLLVIILAPGASFENLLGVRHGGQPNETLLKEGI
jgi:hypothetical protein